MAKAKQKVDPRIAIVDELGKLDAELTPFGDKWKRREALKKKVREWPSIDQIAPESTKAYRGAIYLVTLGAAENERSIISIAKIRAKLGLDWLIAHCKVTLKDLEAALPAGIDELVGEARTGSRTITIAKAA